MDAVWSFLFHFVKGTGHDPVSLFHGFLMYLDPLGKILLLSHAASNSTWIFHIKIHFQGTFSKNQPGQSSGTSADGDKDGRGWGDCRVNPHLSGPLLSLQCPALGQIFLGLNTSSANHELCSLGQVTYPICVSVAISVKWVWLKHTCLIGLLWELNKLTHIRFLEHIRFFQCLATQEVVSKC